MLLKEKPILKFSGFTLIELLVGLFLSLFLIGITLTYMVSSAQSYKVQMNEDMIQENARYSLEVLSRYIRMAGLLRNKNEGYLMNVIYSEKKCPATATEATVGTGYLNACTDDLVESGSAGNESDRFAIDYISSTKACNNMAVAVDTHLISVFWIADLDGDGTSSLYCQPYDVSGASLGNAAPLIDGVDAMQVQYGIDSDSDSLVDTYQPFSMFISDALTQTTDIKTMKVSLLLNSGVSYDNSTNTETSKSREYTLLDGATLTYDDGIVRQIYSTTVMLPNML